MPPRMRRRITTAKREEIENEQKILDNKIVRPFETLNGLPISYNEPPHGNYEEILKNPLTIKDSAVLYNSLIRSRNTYVFHAPMFKLHWVKQTTYAKKLAEMDKEKQKEILKDSSNRRRFAKATTNSLEARTRIPVLSPDVNARDVMSKLCEASMTLGPHTMDIRIFIAKDARSEKSRAIDEIKKFGGKPASPVPQAVHNELVKPEADKPGAHAHTSKSPPTGEMGLMLKSYSEIGRPRISATENAPPNLNVTGTEMPPTETTHQSQEDKLASSPEGTGLNPGKVAEPKEKEIENTGKDSRNDTSDPDKATASPIFSGQGSPAISNSDKIIIGARGFSSKATTLSSEPTVPEAEENSKSASPTKSVEGPEQSTSHEEVKKSSPNPVSGEDPSVKSKPEASGSKIPASASRPSPANLQSIDNTIMISNLNAIAKVDLSLNDLMKEVALGKASEVQISTFKRYIERAKQMGPQPHHAELYFSKGIPLPPNFPKPYLPRTVDRRTPPLLRLKVHNPMKLTAFQEKYLHNATLVFEFLENPNVRYIIPQDSICEVLNPEYPAPPDAEEGAEFNDVLFSHIWTHNVEEMENYERKQQEYELELFKREEEERAAKEEEEKKSKELGEPAEGDQAVEAPLPDARALRTKKKAPPPKKKKPLVPPEKPAVRYTAFSFTVHNIPARYIPIVRNSMKPLKQVQEQMKNVLATGNRVASSYLWYQVDARLDEAFAEDLRNAAVEEEKNMTGFVPPVEAKKRKPRDYKAMRAKKLKENNAAEIPFKVEPDIDTPQKESTIEAPVEAGP